MSAIWKIGLFTKLSATEAKCVACERTIQMTDRTTKGLFTHARTHEEFANKLKKVEENQASQKNSMDPFVKIVPQGQLPSLDKNVVHFVARQNLQLQPSNQYFDWDYKSASWTTKVRAGLVKYFRTLKFPLDY